MQGLDLRKNDSNTYIALNTLWNIPLISDGKVKDHDDDNDVLKQVNLYPSAHIRTLR